MDGWMDDGEQEQEQEQEQEHHVEEQQISMLLAQMMDEIMELSEIV